MTVPEENAVYLEHSPRPQGLLGNERRCSSSLRRPVNVNYAVIFVTLQRRAREGFKRPSFAL